MPPNTPSVSCEDKGPPRQLKTLFSEESGFGENSQSESYSEEDWEEEDEEWDVKWCLHLEDSEETWNEFVEQALHRSPTISPKCPRGQSTPTSTTRQPRSPTSTCQAQPKSFKPDCSHPPQCPQLEHLLVSRVCPERHRLCCKPTSSSTCSSAESSDIECAPSPQTFRK